MPAKKYNVHLHNCIAVGDSKARPLYGRPLWQRICHRSITDNILRSIASVDPEGRKFYGVTWTCITTPSKSIFVNHKTQLLCLNNYSTSFVPVDFSAKRQMGHCKGLNWPTARLQYSFVHVVSKEYSPMNVGSCGILSLWLYRRSKNARPLNAAKNEYQQHLCCNGKIEVKVPHGKCRKSSPNISPLSNGSCVKGFAKFNLLHRIISSVSISSPHPANKCARVCRNGQRLISHFKRSCFHCITKFPCAAYAPQPYSGRSFKSTILWCHFAIRAASTTYPYFPKHSK